MGRRFLWSSHLSGRLFHGLDRIQNNIKIRLEQKVQIKELLQKITGIIDE